MSSGSILRCELWAWFPCPLLFRPGPKFNLSIALLMWQCQRVGPEPKDRPCENSYQHIFVTFVKLFWQWIHTLMSEGSADLDGYLHGLRIHVTFLSKWRRLGAEAGGADSKSTKEGGWFWSSRERRTALQALLCIGQSNPHLQSLPCGAFPFPTFYMFSIVLLLHDITLDVTFHGLLFINSFFHARSRCHRSALSGKALADFPTVQFACWPPVPKTSFLTHNLIITMILWNLIVDEKL